MRLLTGAILIVGAEQAYAHANLIQFPNQVEARTVLLPAALALLVLGVVALIWGALTECRQQGRCVSPAAPSPSTRPDS